MRWKVSTVGCSWKIARDVNVPLLVPSSSVSPDGCRVRLRVVIDWGSSRGGILQRYTWPTWNISDETASNEYPIVVRTTPSVYARVFFRDWWWSMIIILYFFLPLTYRITRLSTSRKSHVTCHRKRPSSSSILRRPKKGKRKKKRKELSNFAFLPGHGWKSSVRLVIRISTRRYTLWSD